MSGEDDINDDDDDFKTQLKFERLERERLERQTSTDGRNLASASTGVDPYTHVDPSDGTAYEWNHEKQAWFPKISDDFIAAYQQANYGGTNCDNYNDDVESSTVASAISAVEESEQKQSGEKRKANETQGWFEVADEHNTNVYVSNLPTNITEDEFVEFMSKCGIIMKDTDTGKLKMKLYTDKDGAVKGDARCCYIKVESVELALKILDGYELRGKRVHVERAKFQMKGDYDPTKKPKKKKSKDKKKIKELQEKLLDWRPDRQRGVRTRFEKTVIIKNMFDPKEFETDATLILEYQNDLREECSKFGTVKKVVVYDRHPEGVASVAFEEAEMADACIGTLHNRWFAGRKLDASAWDGKAKYTVQETDAERETRLRQWEDYLKREEREQLEQKQREVTSS